MNEDDVERLLDVLWRAVRTGDQLDPPTLRETTDVAVLRAARAQAQAQQTANEQVATAGESSRRARRRAEDDAKTYAAMARLCDQAIDADRSTDQVGTGGGPSVVLAPPLLAVEVVVALADRQWARLVRFTTIPRAGDRISVAPVAATVESVVWSLDTNDVAVPTAMCRVAEPHDPRTLRGNGWVLRGAS